MKRLSTAALAALIVTLCGLSAVAAPSNATPGNSGNSVAQGGAAPPADFGSPPSGQIPILYNDHHVYSKPDVLKQGRVLAALVKGGELLIPLRSMFEQMGATVSWDPGSKTATVSKAGAEVKVTVGKPEVVINGESRPLDVPPMMYQGNVLVPVRVISEGMGAYVQWVPDRHIVVVRYIPATPPPSPAPPPPTAQPPLGEAFMAGDYIISPKVYNEFSPGNSGTSSYAIRGAGEFSLGSIPFMLEGSYERYQYPHNCSNSGTTTAPVYSPECYVTVIGANGSAPVLTTTNLYDQDVDGRLAVRVLQPRVYVGVGYLWVTNNYGYPNMNGFGFGAEKLPDLNHIFSFFGSVWYYPDVKGTAAVSVPNPYPATGFTSASLPLQYNILKYQVGLTVGVGNTPVFVEGGWMGDSWTNKQNAPVNRSENGPFAGVGFRWLYP
jgi:hypothetical protein